MVWGEEVWRKSFGKFMWQNGKMNYTGYKGEKNERRKKMAVTDVFGELFIGIFHYYNGLTKMRTMN